METFELYWVDELGYLRVEQHFQSYDDALECIKKNNKKCKKKYLKHWKLYRVTKEEIDFNL